MIRTDCYLAVLKKFKEKYPSAHFEVITRYANHVLSPSWELLRQAKEENWSFKRYKEALLKELLNNNAALEKIKKLKNISRRKVLFLVCYEKDASKCHRTIVKELIKE